MSMQLAVCRRCGIRRNVKPERGIPEVCFDCILVERDLAGMHGTNAGYYRHQRARTVPCDDCLDAHRVYNQRHRTAGPKKRYRRAEHGTESGYHAHRRRYNGWDQLACDDCLAAHRASERARNAAAKARQAA